MNETDPLALSLGSGVAETLSVSREGYGRHRVIKYSYDGKTVVLKCYGLKSKWHRTAIRQFGSLFIVGKSSIAPRARMATERAVLDLWRREGFDVPRLIPEGVPAGLEGRCLAMEWVPGGTLAATLASAGIPLARKREFVGRFGSLLARRHQRAAELNEPRLIFEHPTFEHVLVSGERLVHFDFEIVFVWKKDLKRLMRREIAGFLRSLFKSSGEAFPLLLEDLVRSYHDHASLAWVQRELERYGAVPVLKCLALLQRMFRRRLRYTKRSPIAGRLGEALRVFQEG